MLCISTVTPTGSTMVTNLTSVKYEIKWLQENTNLKHNILKRVLHLKKLHFIRSIKPAKLQNHILLKIPYSARYMHNLSLEQGLLNVKCFFFFILSHISVTKGIRDYIMSCDIIL